MNNEKTKNAESLETVHTHTHTHTSSFITGIFASFLFLKYNLIRENFINRADFVYMFLLRLAI
jgi:hypothetical protein